jgi:hypothetical protein
VVAGAALPGVPWLVRNLLTEGPVTAEVTRLTLVIGAYVDYVFNGDLRTFPWP